jgi:hypothetical protein
MDNIRWRLSGICSCIVEHCATSARTRLAHDL